MEPQDRSRINENINYFVEKTKDSEIILEKLYEKNVFSDKMMQIIRAENTEEKKTRRMYTMIPRRGPLAFQHLYDTFMECGLCDMAVRLKPKISVRYGYGEETSLINITSATTRMDVNNKVYEMGSRPKGYMLLIIIDSAPGFETWNSKHDEKLLKELWESLGYKICLEKKNLSKKELKDAVIRFRNMPVHENVHSCVVHILCPAHVNENVHLAINICCGDGNTIKSESIMDYFKRNNCYHLRKKPKMFFFHLYGCKKKIEYDCFMSEDIKPDEIGPNDSDIFYVNTLVDGSLQHSVFIEYMAKVFSVHAHNTDLLTMMSRISRETQSLEETLLHMPWELRGHFKLLYFHPGLYD